MLKSNITSSEIILEKGLSVKTLKNHNINIPENADDYDDSNVITKVQPKIKLRKISLNNNESPKLKSYGSNKEFYSDLVEES
jgi:hypothetical protein